MSELTKFDHFLSDDGPAALVIREPMMPVEGMDAVLFPATYAAGDNFAGGYNIDSLERGRKPDDDSNGDNVCLIDSVGSQANRIEPIFATEKYAGLVPQLVVKAGEKSINIVEAGHRAGDAIVRCSELQQELQDAFNAVLRGNAEPMAKIAPTSLVFGVWDSRGTQAKLPRLVSSTIRAFNVRKLTRSANYLVQQQHDYAKDGLVPEWADLTDAEKKELSKYGYQNALATKTHGGVIATGGIRRDAVLGLAALRLLAAGDEERTLSLRRYVLGLALTAFTASPSGYLRQGCLLVSNPDEPREFVEVHADGKRVPSKITHDEALKFAKATAKAFGIDPDRKIEPGKGPDRDVQFDKERAKRDVKGEGDSKTKAKKGVKKADAAVPPTEVSR